MYDAKERAWIGGRATSLRLDGTDPVEASKQATFEMQEMKKGLVPVRNALTGRTDWREESSL